MPQGLQVWDSSGNLIVDTNSSLGVILGTHTITKSAGNGSLSVGDLSLGTPFFTVITSTGTFYPIVSVSGSTISWTYDLFAQIYEPGTSTYTILYGYR